MDLKGRNASSKILIFYYSKLKKCIFKIQK